MAEDDENGEYTRPLNLRSKNVIASRPRLPSQSSRLEAYGHS
jgi:hypothetical protein